MKNIFFAKNVQSSLLAVPSLVLITLERKKDNETLSKTFMKIYSAFLMLFFCVVG